MLLVGAHAMSGTPDGVLSHTVSTESWYLVTINGAQVGETGIMAAIAGAWGTPVVFASGDEATCREVRGLLGEGVVTVPVKQGLGRYTARHMAPADARALIEAKVAEALRNRSGWPAPLVFVPPVAFQVELTTPDRAEAFYGRSGVEIMGPRTVRAVGENFWKAWDAFWHRT